MKNRIRIWEGQVFEGRRKEDNLTFLYNFYLKIEKKNEQIQRGMR